MIILIAVNSFYGIEYNNCNYKLLYNIMIFMLDNLAGRVTAES